MTTPAHTPDPAATFLSAVTAWLSATATPSAVTAGFLTAEHPGHGMTRGRLSPTQADRLAHLLNTDTAVITAHHAAEAAHLKATQEKP